MARLSRWPANWWPESRRACCLSDSRGCGRRGCDRRIPVVMAWWPIRSAADYQESSDPGGNITGISGATAELTAENMELIKEVILSVRRVAFFGNHPKPSTRHDWQRPARRSRIDIEVKVILARAGTFRRHSRKHRMGAEAALSQPSLPLNEVAASAAKSKLPAFCPNAAYTAAGGLMAYSADRNRFISRWPPSSTRC